MFPEDITNQQRAEFDITWRVRALNQSFQRKIAELDPAVGDFDSLVEFYVYVRKSIGVPTSLHLNADQGTKRKNQEEPVQDDIDSSRKRAKTASTGIEIGKKLDSGNSQSSGFVGADAQSPPSGFSSSSKRKAADDDNDTEGGDQHGKRPKPGDDERPKQGVSDTVTMFASSFVSHRNENENLSPVSSGENSSHSGANSQDGGDENSSSTSQTPSENDAKDDDAVAGAQSSSSEPSDANSNGHSLFSRVEFGQTRNAHRDDEKDEKSVSSTEKPADPLTSLLSGSKFAPSFSSGSATPQFSFAGIGDKSGSQSTNDSVQNGEKPAPSSELFPKTSSSAQDSGSPSQAPSVLNSGTSNSPAIGGTPSIFASGAGNPFGSKPNGSSIFQNGTPQPSPFSLSASTSGDPSRSNTPGASENETGGDDEGEGNENLPQVDLTRGGAGEEEEEIMHEVRARAMKLQPSKGWEVQGVGLFRVLKHKSSKRTRVLLRADPSGKVLLNTYLVPQISYQSSGSGVWFLVPKESEKPEQWAVRVKTADAATELSSIMEKCKQK